MTLIKLPAHKAGLFISHNEHRYSGRDVAAYCAFLWYHEASTKPQDANGRDEPRGQNTNNLQT